MPYSIRLKSLHRRYQLVQKNYSKSSLVGMVDSNHRRHCQQIFAVLEVKNQNKQNLFKKNGDFAEDGLKQRIIV